MNEHIAPAKQRAAIDLKLFGGNLERVEHALDGLAGHGRRLEHLNVPGFILNNEIGEGAAGIGRETHCCFSAQSAARSVG